MGLKIFFKNIKYLSRYNIKDFNTLFKKNNQATFDDKILKTINQMLDNIVYELPEHLNLISKPRIKNLEETVDALINSNSSFCRFGDGELIIINGGEIGFQKADSILAARLKEILTSQNDNIFIGINYHYYSADLSMFHDYVKFVYRSFITPIRQDLNKLLINNKQYYAAGFTSIYTTLKDYDFDSYFSKAKQIWANKDIVIICGERIFNHIDYNIFDCANSIEYQYAPTENAFDKYSEILENAKKIDKKKMVVSILGPTAKILAYDLALLGYRALDLGHIAKDYDAYMKKMPCDRINIGKFFEPD